MPGAPGESIRNIGPKSRRWLAGIGIRTTAQLAARGAVSAYVQLKAEGYPATKNLLWAMHAAVLNRDWRDLTPAEKDALSRQVPRF